MEAIPKSEKTYAIAVTNFENIVPVEGCEVIGASHPIPCINGFNASKKIINCLTKTTPNDIAIQNPNFFFWSNSVQTCRNGY